MLPVSNIKEVSTNENIMPILPDLQSYIDAVEKGVGKLAEWGKEVDEVMAKQGTLTKVQTILNELGVFKIASAISPFFSAASGGLMVLGEILGIKDKEDQMLEKLDSISGQISKLSEQLDIVYYKIISEMDLHTAKLQVSPAVDDLIALQTAYDHILTTPKVEQDTVDPQVLDLLERIIKDVNVIVAVAGGDEVHYSLLKAIYEKSDGNYAMVLHSSHYLLKYALLGVKLYCAYNAYYYEKTSLGNKIDKSAPPATQCLTLIQEGTKEAGSIFSDPIETLKTHIQDYLNKCTQRDCFVGNMKNFINVQYNNHTDFRSSEKWPTLINGIVDDLVLRWPMYDWMATMSYYTDDSAHQGWAGNVPETHLEWKGEFGSPTKKLDLIIAWIDKESPFVERGSIINEARTWLHQAAHFEGYGIIWTSCLPPDEFASLVDAMWKRPIIPHRSIKLCWHDDNLIATCNNPSRLFLNHPRVDPYTGVIDFDRLKGLSFYDILIFV